MIGNAFSLCSRGLGRSCQQASKSYVTLTKKGSWGNIISHGPIKPFSLQELGIDQERFLKDHKPIFHTLKADSYDQRKEQLDFLEIRFPDAVKSVKEEDFTGKATFEQTLCPLYDQLSPEEKREFDTFVPYRYRAIARFSVSFDNGECSVNRIPTDDFVQTHALISKEKVDVRKFVRKFEELDERHSNLETFKHFLSGVSGLIHKINPEASKFDMTAHYVKVITRDSLIRGNSPEGIHKDGYPWLVTALVVERKDVEGGESRIFAPDKKTQIFSMTLQEGQGILQPDLGTDLWHTVTRVRPAPGSSEGYRSIVGLDIAIVDEKK